MLEITSGSMIETGMQNGILKSVPSKEFSFLERHFETFSIEAGTRLGDLGPYVLFIDEGVVLLTRTAGDLTVGFVGNEGALGVFRGMGLGEEPLSGMFLTAGVGRRISAADFARAIADLPAMRQAVLTYVRDTMEALATEVHTVATKSLCARVAMWLLAIYERGHREPLAITHHFLAQCLDVRRAGVTDALHILEGIKAVRSTRGMVAVLDVEVLRQVAVTPQPTNPSSIPCPLT